MIFLPNATIDAVEKLLEQLEKTEGDKEPLFRQILALNPHDPYVLTSLAELRREVDPAESQQFYWRLAETVPTDWVPYIRLAGFYDDADPLCQGLAELSRDKAHLYPGDDEDSLPDLKLHVASLEHRRQLKAPYSLATWLTEARELEPLAVSQKLRPHRLIHWMQEHEVLAPVDVDIILQEGAAMLPLLLGVLRCWLQDIFPPESDLAQNALAILGEIAGPGVIPDLLQLSVEEDIAVAGASSWALDRIIGKRPEDAVRILRETAPNVPGEPRISIAQCLLHYPDLDPQGTLYESLFANFEHLDKASRDDCFMALLSTGIALRGRAGLDMARIRLRRDGPLLSKDGRRAADEMLAEYSTLDLSSPDFPGPSPWTVHQICGGEVDWEKELLDDGTNDEAFIPEPIQRKSVPGRNDPCWCGSGKKYKKCHLDSDEERERESRG